MSKHLLVDEEICTCTGCPYCRYDSSYSMNTDSGYDCHHDEAPQFRIMGDNQITKNGGEVTIPEWCPLSDFTPTDVQEESTNDR